MSASFDDLVVAVGGIKDTVESGIVVIHDLADRVAALGDAPTPAQIQALAADIRGEASRLSEAIAAVPPA